MKNNNSEYNVNNKKETNTYIIKLLNEKKELEFKQWDSYNKFKEFQSQVIEIKKQILKTCNHVWVPDHSYYDHCTVYICEICKLNR